MSRASAGGGRSGTALALALVLAACSPAADRSTLTAPAETTGVGDPAAYVVAPGESFEIRLAANPTTGFAWELGAPLDGDVVRSVATTYAPKEGGAVGAGGISRWTFEGVGPGRTSIVLVYRRPWEPEVAPARVAVYSVVVD